MFVRCAAKNIIIILAVINQRIIVPAAQQLIDVKNVKSLLLNIRVANVNAAVMISVPTP